MLCSFLNSSTVLVTTLPLPPAPPTLQLQSTNQNSLKLTWHRKQDKGCTYALEMKQANNEKWDGVVLLRKYNITTNCVGIKLCMRAPPRAIGSQDSYQTPLIHSECVVVMSQAKVTGVLRQILSQQSHYPLLQKVWYSLCVCQSLCVHVCAWVGGCIRVFAVLTTVVLVWHTICQ